MSQLEVLQDLIAEVISTGASVHDDVEFKYEESSGVGVFASADIEKGAVIFGIPFNMCITKESVTSYPPLAQLFLETPSLLDWTDEVLAIALLYAMLKSDTNCPWRKHVLTMPRSFNTTLFWSDQDLEAIKGHNVFHLTGMLKRQILNDFQSIYQPLSETYPDILGGVDLDLYAWALSVVYSRSLDITRKDETFRIVVPVLDMVNHNPHAAPNASDTFQYDEALDQVNFVACTDMKAGDEMYAVYGQYPNAKLMYNYGFVILKNPVRAIDLWTRLVPTNYEYEAKNQLLQSNPLTQNQTYDFQGTIRNNYVAPALLATIRVIQADAHDMANIARAFEGRMISVRNEAATYVSLRNLIQARLKAETAQVCVIFVSYCLCVLLC